MLLHMLANMFPIFHGSDESVDGVQTAEYKVMFFAGCQRSWIGVTFNKENLLSARHWNIILKLSGCAGTVSRKTHFIFRITVQWTNWRVETMWRSYAWWTHRKLSKEAAELHLEFQLIVRVPDPQLYCFGSLTDLTAHCTRPDQNQTADRRSYTLTGESSGEFSFEKTADIHQVDTNITAKCVNKQPAAN